MRTWRTPEGGSLFFYDRAWRASRPGVHLVGEAEYDQGAIGEQVDPARRALEDEVLVGAFEAVHRELHDTILRRLALL